MSPVCHHAFSGMERMERTAGKVRRYAGDGRAVCDDRFPAFFGRKSANKGGPGAGRKTVPAMREGSGSLLSV